MDEHSPRSHPATCGLLLACLLACLTSMLHASVSQGRISSDNLIIIRTATTTTIIITIIVFKDTILHFLQLLSVPRTVSTPTLKRPGRNRVQITCNTSIAYHVQHILCHVAQNCLLVGWLLNVPATCECISGTDLHRQFYVLPH